MAYAIPPFSQEAKLYHNQTTELRELLEFTHVYLQSDDEVSGPLCSRLGCVGTPWAFSWGYCVGQVSPAVLKWERIAYPSSAPPLLSSPQSSHGPFSACPTPAHPGQAHMVPPPGSPGSLWACSANSDPPSCLATWPGTWSYLQP